MLPLSWRKLLRVIHVLVTSRNIWKFPEYSSCLLQLQQRPQCHLPFSVPPYSPLSCYPLCLQSHVYFIPKRLPFSSFFFSSFPFSLFRLSKWMVSTIDVFCLLSIFYLFFRAPSPMEKPVSCLQKSLTMQCNMCGQTPVYCRIWLPFFSYSLIFN